MLAAAVLFSGFLTVGCSSQPPQIEIAGQYAELSPVFFGVGSVFMTIRNAGGGDAVTGITVNVPGALVELHDVKDRRMVKVEKIAVPAHGSAELKPGGLHIMVFNMPRTTREGNEIVLTLAFQRSGERKVPVRFVKPKELPAETR
jgi:periplasmic copper chaperone A